MDGKIYRSNELYKVVEKEMKERGSNKKNSLQIKTKWKTLKSNYIQNKKHNSISGNNRKIDEKYQDLLSQLLDQRPCTNVDGIDSSQSTTEDEIIGKFIDITY